MKSNNKPWADALRRAVHQRIDGDPDRPFVLDAIARKVARDALEGQAYAVADIGNRLDGRPAQALTVEDVTPPRLEGADRLHELARKLAFLVAAPAGDQVADLVAAAKVGVEAAGEDELPPSGC